MRIDQHTRIQLSAASGRRRGNQSSGLRTGFTLVDPGSESGVTSLHKGFTLVELMIVVAVLGILAGIVIPEFSGHIQKARESASKETLRVIREAIGRYAADHNDIPPGYLNDDTTEVPRAIRTQIQLTEDKRYLTEIPKNPFNGRYNIYMVNDSDTLPSDSVGDYGWIYQPSTKTFKINQGGLDSEGTAYLDY